jgi:uncharacterized damage-inducible protein DinB
MTRAEILNHFAYNKWANDRTIDAVATLSTEQVMRPMGSSFSSIRDTAAHIASAEWVWLRRWTGHSPSSHPDWARQGSHGSMDEIAAKCREIEAERAAWFATLTDKDLGRRVAFRLLNGTEDAQPLSAQLMHVVNHSSYHRGQIAGLMRQVGGTPVSTDLIAYQRTLAD